MKHSKPVEPVYRTIPNDLEAFVHVQHRSGCGCAGSLVTVFRCRECKRLVSVCGEVHERRGWCHDCHDAPLLDAIFGVEGS